MTTISRDMAALVDAAMRRELVLVRDTDGRPHLVHLVGPDTTLASADEHDLAAALLTARLLQLAPIPVTVAYDGQDVTGQRVLATVDGLGVARSVREDEPPMVPPRRTPVRPAVRAWRMGGAA